MHDSLLLILGEKRLFTHLPEAGRLPSLWRSNWCVTLCCLLLKKSKQKVKTINASKTWKQNFLISSEIKCRNDYFCLDSVALNWFSKKHPSRGAQIFLLDQKPTTLEESRNKITWWSTLQSIEDQNLILFFSFFQSI